MKYANSWRLCYKCQRKSVYYAVICGKYAGIVNIPAFPAVDPPPHPPHPTPGVFQAAAGRGGLPLQIPEIRKKRYGDSYSDDTYGWIELWLKISEQ